MPYQLGIFWIHVYRCRSDFERHAALCLNTLTRSGVGVSIVSFSFKLLQIKLGVLVNALTWLTCNGVGVFKILLTCLGVGIVTVTCSACFSRISLFLGLGVIVNNM